MQGIYRVLLVIYVALATKVVVIAAANQHIAIWDTTTNFVDWASGETFKVGDQLTFKYTPGFHSVLEVTSEEYKACYIQNGVSLETNVVTLTKAGTRYFVCGTPSHCELGMRLKVTVGGDGAPSVDSPLSKDSPPSYSTDQHIAVWDTTTNFVDWAAGETFKVGDQLTFKYIPGFHSVLEVSSKEYEACYIQNGVSLETNVVALTKAGTRYFVCGTPSHCELGMRLKVVVGGGGTPSMDSPPSSRNPTSAALIPHPVGGLSFILAPFILACLI